MVMKIPMRTLTISLSDSQIRRLQSAVETGAYASNSEVVRDALRLWEQHEELRNLEMAHLKRAYEDGMASGDQRELDANQLLLELKSGLHRRA